jgi:predicted site-specific integrase-resolvase
MCEHEVVTVVDRHPGVVYDYVQIRCEECGWEWVELEPAMNPFADYDEIMNELPRNLELVSIRLYHQRENPRRDRRSES